MTRAGKVSATDAEIDAAIVRGRKYDRAATKIISAEYDRKLDRICATLSTGATVLVPRGRLPRLDTCEPDDLGEVQIEPPGYALWFDKPDIGVRIEALLRAVAGEVLIRSIAAQAMGAATSERKSEAARKNGAAGGRPATRRRAIGAGLDGRTRDVDGTIRRKSGDTRISDLRDTYGSDFGAGYRSDMKLETLLDRTGSNSLNDYLKKKK